MYQLCGGAVFAVCGVGRIIHFSAGSFLLRLCAIGMDLKEEGLHSMTTDKIDSRKQGVLPDTDLQTLCDSKVIDADEGFDPDQIQPASIDLRLGDKAYRMRASFLPGEGRSTDDLLQSNMVMHELDLSEGAVLEMGCVYLVPLEETLNLPQDLSGAANPKSSTGRIDVFVRMVCDGADRFDLARPGYSGPLYVEISPRTFSILARKGDRLLQLRLRRGPQQPMREMTFSVDLKPGNDDIAGYRAKRHCGVIDLARIGEHAVQDFWEPVRPHHGTIILDPGEFYILASKEVVVIPVMEAAEMAPIAPEFGEFRAHYAGFFDPGFGVDAPEGRAVLEVRSREVPFILRDGQPVGRLVFEPMTAAPAIPYGHAGSSSNYQGQGLRLSKHFQR